MDELRASPWTILQSIQTYAINFWGEGYFSINAKGNVSVRPDSNLDTELDLFEIAQSLEEKQLSFPVLVRFTDILQDRVKRLNQAFQKAFANQGYHGKYTPIYPIKVNQQGKVVEGILASENIGLEAGSKPELLAVMALSKPGGTVVCNGYKDRAYIRLALIGLKLGLQVYLVIEKPIELDMIIAESAKLGITPLVGVRVRLASISAGKWQNTGGEKSKFGLHANEVLQLVARLKQADLLDCLQLMHFHMGSQIANIHDIKVALKEVGQFYAELHRLGAPIKIVDAGGGLGVDYDGSRSRRESSINYSLEEYAQNIVRSFAEICSEKQLPQPDIVTESGRAITAHHAVLITNVTDIESVYSNPSDANPLPVAVNLVETYHDAQFDLKDAQEQFSQGKLSINKLAAIENSYAVRCQQIKSRLNPSNQNEAAILKELNEKLADKIFCNFSLFQSLPDIWGIDQIFPIMPIHRLNEQPTRRAVIQDLTCDSDGRIDQYIDGQNIAKTLPVHEIASKQPYLIGFFMVGAYQEILGDMHNLFGDTHSINIELDDQGYHFYDLHEGEHVGDLLDYVHISSDDLRVAYRKKLADSTLTDQLRLDYEKELMAGLTSYTYLSK
ncbi:biosynthetic arginine decarboxylase SpeA [Methyloglobulus morosus KoM1]|uniref:Arginine decarboxylase n=1 Tax=Methyloglobulus morosus KoM1 TaxID=1116472 RepID=V5DV43_9GAMM|nr:biosynthetic arginine decarboxylase [Methyloglobulus morosus]ESS71276.1 biosynthetic arginine decarboxylase SpeA [Methyloglobulus morosus KoM1]